MKTRFPYPLRTDTLAIGKHSLDLVVIDGLERTIDLLFLDAETGGDKRFLEDLAPYFGVVWPSARALALELESKFDPSWKGKRILELGCGLAIPTQILAKCGAEVTASDFHPDVPEFLRENLVQNGIADRVKYWELDWHAPLQASQMGSWDLIVGSDILYELPKAAALAKLLNRLLSEDGEAWIADPGRSFLQSYEKALEAEGLTCEVDARDEVFLLKSRKRRASDRPAPPSTA